MSTSRPEERAVRRSVESARLDPDDLFHALQNERRRRVLRYLLDADGETFAIGDIAESIAAVENECDRKLVSSDQRKRVYVALYQCHLPQLDEVGLIDYNQSRGLVAAGPTLEQAATYLEMTAPDECIRPVPTGEDVADEDSVDGVDDDGVDGVDEDGVDGDDAGAVTSGKRAAANTESKAIGTESLTENAKVDAHDGGVIRSIRRDLAESTSGGVAWLDGGIVAAGATGVVATVGMTAWAGVWAGVLGASTALGAVVAVALIALAVAVACC